MARGGITCLMVSGVVVCSVLTFAARKMMVSQTYLEMDAIVAAQDLTEEQKVQKLRAYFDREPFWTAVLSRIDQVNPAAGRQIALELFRARTTSQEQKYALGSYLFERGGSPEFADEYAAFLVDAVLHGGKQEFCRKNDEGRRTAVGEYVTLLACDRPISRGIPERLKDPRVIPILIRCLKAPDNVYPNQQGDHIRGRPGTSTGRNMARQNIPLALAALGAKEGVKALRAVFSKHHDVYLRANAAFALGVLLDSTRAKTFGEQLLQSPPPQTPAEGLVFLGYGRGLIAKGDDAGIPFLEFRLSGYSPSSTIRSALHMIQERLRVLRGIKTESRALEAFYRQALTYAPLHDILLFDDAAISFDGSSVLVESGPGCPRKVTDGKEALKAEKPNILEVYRDILAGLELNRLRGLFPLISDIKDQTRDPDIRTLSDAFLAKVR